MTTTPIIFTSACDECGEEMYPEEEVWVDGFRDKDGNEIGQTLCESCAARLFRSRKNPATKKF